MEKLVVGMIGDKCSDTLELSLLSIKDIASCLIFVWGMEDNRVPKILERFSKEHKIPTIIVNNPWDSNDKKMNGKARNHYLGIMQKQFYGEWALVLDPDEALDDPKPIIECMKKYDGKNRVILYPRMRHLVYSLSQEDSIVPVHNVPGRLFKIDHRMFYPETEHPVISIVHDSAIIEKADEVLIWHFGHSRNMFDVRAKFLGHLKKSEVPLHTKEYLQDWYFTHITGKYPVSKVDLLDYPQFIRDYFEMDKQGMIDREYFKNRQELEMKHPLIVSDMIYTLRPKSVLDVGCGGGQFTYLFNRWGVDCLGIDKSEYVIEENNKRLNRYKCCDLLNLNEEKRDLVIALDVLEHLRYEDLDRALDIIKKHGDRFVFCVPLKNNEFADGDKTHIIKEDREWWIDRIRSRGYTIRDTPNWPMKEHYILSW